MEARLAAARAGVVSTADVHLFAEAYRTLDPSDTTCAALRGYLNNGSDGLRVYRKRFKVDHQRLCSAVRRSPQRYAALETKLPALGVAAAQVTALFDRFQALYPGARLPEVYFVVGTGIAGGSATGGRRPIVLIGMELNDSVAALPRLLAHEFVHTVQKHPFWGAMNGGPQWMRGTLLRHSIKEGAADFIAELLTGVPVRNSFAEARERELWEEFQRDRRSRDYNRWLYNGRSATDERPTDLGYWMGYRITKAYYDRAPDKSKAIREILTIRDFEHFLVASGYGGGR